MCRYVLKYLFSLKLINIIAIFLFFSVKYLRGYFRYPRMSYRVLISVLVLNATGAQGVHFTIRAPVYGLELFL